MTASGPESLAFDRAGGGPYTGVVDGRILKWSPQRRRWSPFAIPPRAPEGACNGSGFFQPTSICGRPLGLQFHHATGRLYIADAFYGLLAVAAGAEDRPFRFANAVDVDQETGAVYFTDSSARFGIRDHALAVLSGDTTGRLLSYREASAAPPRVLLRGLAFPNGVALGGGGAFVLVAETTRCRVLRYWLRGRAAGRAEVFAELPEGDTGWGSTWEGCRKGRRGVRWQRGWGGREGVGGGGGLRRRGAVSEVVETRSGELWIGSVVRPYVEVFKKK
ncbi:unnamed protein product [Spirodela intermedia]|uniref:Strictosidine synthase conserved region domain-containing protein n=1 Tax=Spirodela intermedia TaxID=51605 RepID=A0A7I8JKE9_SPIIN|nr:unnamed protein product [Spirodela intermedia]CAA6670656.1 unnamed protein product [Spirodela intermedia]